jgi:hypothetical protein
MGEWDTGGGQLPWPHRPFINKEKMIMKKFAVMIAGLVLFAGCAQNDEGDLGATDTTTTDTTSTGAAAPGQIGSDTNNAPGTMSTEPVPSPLDTNQLNQPDNVGAPGQTEPGIDQSSNPSVPPPAGQNYPAQDNTQVNP